MTELVQQTNKYQNRLEQSMKLAGYDELDDSTKGVIAALAYDKELDIVDFNEAVNAEIHKPVADTARKKIRSSTLSAVAVERPSVSPELISGLPHTSEEARQMTGHSIEDVVGCMHDVDDDGILSAFDAFGELSDKDKEFYDDKCLGSHQESVDKITLAFMKRFPEKYRREAEDYTYGAYHKQEMFLQHDSPAFLRAKLIEGKTDKPSVRMYLNPELTDATAIYAEFLNKALEQKLRFKSKIIRANAKDNYSLHYKPEYLDKGVGKLDPIVIYGYEESKDDLLKIVEEIRQAHASSFEGRKIGGSPLEIAEGVGIGDEVSDSGESSLTSSRVGVAKNVLKELRDKNPNWSQASPEARKRAFAGSLRKRYESLGYNPDNIAFNI